MTPVLCSHLYCGGLGGVPGLLQLVSCLLGHGWVQLEDGGHQGGVEAGRGEAGQLGAGHQQQHGLLVTRGPELRLLR